MQYRILYFLVVSLLFFSCEAKWGKYGGYKMNYDSELQYYIVLDKSDTIGISKGDDRVNITPYPGAFLKFHINDSIVDTCFFGKGAVVINTFVNEAKYNDYFIIVDQTLLGKICECSPQCIEEKYGKEGFTPTSFDLCKKALKESLIHDYWIIDKRTDNVYGPYGLNKYLLKKKELKVSPKLKLKTEN